MLKKTLAAIAACTIISVSADARTVTLDEGSFRLSIAGKEVGTETFSIRQSGAGEGAVIIAVGRVVLDGSGRAQELSSELQVGGRSLRPAAYEVRVQGNGAERITGRVVGSRFSAQIVSAAGESMREYLAGDGAVLADEGVAHHYYFLAKRLDAGATRIPIIIPRQNRQVTAQVSAAGSERIAVAGQSIDARKINVAPAGGTARTVWVDAEGRVLRLEIPGSDIVAQRVQAPK